MKRFSHFGVIAAVLGVLTMFVLPAMPAAAASSATVSSAQSWPSDKVRNPTADIYVYPHLISPNYLKPEDPYSYSSVVGSQISAVRTVYGDPGITISIAIYAGMSVTATASYSVTGEVSVIVAHADMSLGLSLAVSVTAAVTYSGSYTVPQTAHVGWLGAGAYADRMNWSHGHYIGTQWVIDRHGVLQAPYRMPYFWRGYS